MRRLTDQHSTAGRAPGRAGITRTVPPGRSVAVRGYASRRAAAHSIAGVLSLWSDMPVVGLVMALIAAAVLVSQYNYYWWNETREFDN